MKFHKFDYDRFGKVYIANEETNAQEWAMIAAMYSRSVDGVEEMQRKVTQEGSGKFLETYYVGYGHESIGDLVNVKIFLEGIPLFLAPLIEHYALFRGQESSTRYIDFSSQPLFGEDQASLKAQIGCYLNALKTVKDKLRSVNEITNATQSRAVDARAFDICRGLIPLGACTNVAWYGDIHSIKGHLAWMRDNHPWSNHWTLGIYDALKSVYPQSMEKLFQDMRPREPWVFDRGCAVVMRGTIDFGSWRDLNRHRVGRHSFNLPRPFDRLEDFYVNMMQACGYDGRPAFQLSCAAGQGREHRLLGQVIPFSYEMPETQADYFCWRRNQMDVHPTLRLPVQNLAIKTGRAKDFVPDVGLGYVEKRGNQTIIHKQDA